MIFFGARVRYKVLQRDLFLCPSCKDDRNYERKQGRVWFTLYFVPLIPLRRVRQEFVECETCRACYEPSVLERPTTVALSANLEAAMCEAVVRLLRDSREASPATLAAARAVLSTATSGPVTDNGLSRHIDHLDISGLSGRLALLATSLSEQGRETFLARCAQVAVADGVVTSGEAEFLREVGAALGMTEAHTSGVMAQVSRQVRN